MLGERVKWVILFSLTTLSIIEAKFDFKLKYCRFKCSDNYCEACEDPGKKSDALRPGAFYYRDFYGEIPPDAYPLGKSNQFPQTYIGLVYDPEHNGTYITTITAGLHYVYSVTNDVVTKLTKHIQIFCTMEPEKFSWFKLTNDNIGTIKDATFVTAGVDFFRVHPGRVHYIGKTSKCMVTYVGYLSALNRPMEYALLDGTLEKTKNHMWLIYRPNKSAQKAAKKKTCSFIRHRYEYSINPNSIIPKFYKQLDIGPCSIICTNENTNAEDKFKKNNTLLATMSYYWQPKQVVDGKYAIPGGIDVTRKPIVIGQCFNIFRWLDVAIVNLKSKSSYTMWGTTSLEERTYYHVLSTQTPDMFEWVHTTKDTFPSLDKSRFISGGAMDNGTEIIVGRLIDRPDLNCSGGIKLFKERPLIYTWLDVSDTFEVLMLKKQKE